MPLNNPEPHPQPETGDDTEALLNSDVLALNVESDVVPSGAGVELEPGEVGPVAMASQPRSKLRWVWWAGFAVVGLILAGGLGFAVSPDTGTVQTAQPQEDEYANYPTSLVPTEETFTDIGLETAIGDIGRLDRNSIDTAVQQGLEDVGIATTGVGVTEGDAAYVEVVVLDHQGTCQWYQTDADGITTFTQEVQADECQLDVASDDVTRATVQGLERFAETGLRELLKQAGWGDSLTGEAVAEAANSVVADGGTIFGNSWTPFQVVYLDEVSVWVDESTSRIILASVGAPGVCVRTTVTFDGTLATVNKSDVAEEWCQAEPEL